LTAGEHYTMSVAIRRWTSPATVSAASGACQRE
jgi:hypothetical protein